MVRGLSWNLKPFMVLNKKHTTTNTREADEIIKKLESSSKNVRLFDHERNEIKQGEQGESLSSTYCIALRA